MHLAKVARELTALARDDKPLKLPVSSTVRYSALEVDNRPGSRADRAVRGFNPFPGLVAPSSARKALP